MDNITILCVVLYMVIALWLGIYDFEHDVSPQSLYCRGLNWFGAIFIFIVCLLFNPIGLAFRTLYWTYRLFKWLFTVGR